MQQNGKNGAHCRSGKKIRRIETSRLNTRDQVTTRGHAIHSQKATGIASENSRHHLIADNAATAIWTFSWNQFQQDQSDRKTKKHPEQSPSLVRIKELLQTVMSVDLYS